jgi:type I restriction enzyme M protein
MSISSTIKSIQDIMRKDTGVDGDAQRIGQLVWLLFLKIFDDREQEWELLDKKYRSPLPEQCRWRNWAADPEGITGDELKQFIDNTLFPTLQNLQDFSTTPAAFVVRGVFEDAYNFMKSGQLLRQVINKIQEGIDFNKAQERHEFGNLYEHGPGLRNGRLPDLHHRAQAQALREDGQGRAHLAGQRSRC